MLYLSGFRYFFATCLLMLFTYYTEKLFGSSLQICTWPSLSDSSLTPAWEDAKAWQVTTKCLFLVSLGRKKNESKRNDTSFASGLTQKWYLSRFLVIFSFYLIDRFLSLAVSLLWLKIPTLLNISSLVDVYLIDVFLLWCDFCSISRFLPAGVSTLLFFSAYYSLFPCSDRFLPTDSFLPFSTLNFFSMIRLFKNDTKARQTCACMH